jgi:hypothetical protein
MGEFLLHMKSHPLWEEFQEELLKVRPTVPNYDRTADNTDEWKYNSAMQQGFDLCLTIFQIGVEENDQ